MGWPPLEVADLVRAAGDAFIEQSRNGSAGSTSKCYWLSCVVVPPCSADISMSALAADIAPSPTTLVEIGIARSVRRALANVGWKSVAGNFFRHLTCMWSSRYPVSWPRWCCRTRRSSTIFCFAPVRKHFSKLRTIQNISAQKSVSSACCIPGVKNSNFTRMCIAWCLPVASRRSHLLDQIRYDFFLPVKVLGRVFRGKFVAALRRAFQNGRLRFHGDLKPLAQPKTFSSWLRPLFRKDWVVYAKRPFGGRACAPLSGPLYPSRSHLQSPTDLLRDDKVTFRWRDSAHTTNRSC